MTFPTTVRRATAVSSTTNSTTWSPGSLTFGANTAISSGERVVWLLFVSSDGNTGTVTETSGTWVKEGAQGASLSAAQGVLFTLETTAAYAASAFPAINISNTVTEQFSLCLVALKVSSGATVGYIAEQASSGDSTNSDPAAITNSSGAAQDVVVVCSRSGDSTAVATVAPTNYGNLQTATAGGTAGASTNTAERQINIASGGTENPGTFTSATEQWACWTIGIYEVSGSPDVTVGLTGQSITGALGTLIAAASLALAGGGLSSSQGSLSPQTASVLAGQSVTAAQGPVSPASSVALNGQGLTSARGTVSVAATDVTVALTGSGLAAAQGAPAPASSKAATGQALSTAAGTALASTSKALSGQALTAVQGSLASSASRSLSGQALASVTGSVAPSFGLALSGQAASWAQGSVTISGGSVTVSLSGQGISGSQGLLIPARTFALAGNAISTAQGNASTSSGPSLTGIELTAATGTLEAHAVRANLAARWKRLKIQRSDYGYIHEKRG